MRSSAPRSDLRRYAGLSVATAVVTILLKAVAWRLTGSVGLLSDALEGLVNLGAAGLAYLSLTVAARPPDDSHAYGHDKAEYFAAGIEGALVLAAAGSIVWAALPRLAHPAPIEAAGVGLAVSGVATLLNFAVARVLLRAARQHGSPTLDADGRHLMTDVWSSAGVVVAVGLVAVTGWTVLDPLVALAVAAVIVWTGVRLVGASAYGLTDPVLPPDDLAAMQAVFDRYRAGGVDFHALRTRRAGARRFASVHVLVPPEWTVQRGHDLLERIEADLRAALPGLSTLTHLEPLGDPVADDDIQLDRG